MTEITDLDATTLSAVIHRRDVSCREVMEAYLHRIHLLNPGANAIVSLADDDQLLGEAAICDQELMAGESRGWMHGMPQAIKDLNDAVGFPTTFGSRLYRDNHPDHDSLMVRRMRAAGCIVIGKTNAPEFGLGSHTFNEVFGATPNAYDVRVSAGGSSGGAAVGLAHRLLPVADGSDYGGSLRNPAGWSNTFGFRPSQGRVPSWPTSDVWTAQLSTDGPMGRTVGDVAALLATQAGYDARDAMSRTDSAAVSSGRLPKICDLRFGWLGDLGGHLATDRGVLDICQAGLGRLAEAGAVIEPMTLKISLDQVWDAWLTWRWTLVGATLRPSMAKDLARSGSGESWLKPEAHWEYEHAQLVTGPELMAASGVRTQLYQTMLGLFEHVDVLVLPTSQVWPFPIADRWPTSIAGRSMDTYHRWMETSLYATFCGLPSLSVPVGFGEAGLAMGMQFIGRPGADVEVLAVGAAYEELISDILALRPNEPAR